MANEQQVNALSGVIWARPTPDVSRTSALFGLIWARPTPDIARVSGVHGIVWGRIVRTWDNIPGAMKVHFPGGLTDPDEMGYFRGRFTIGTGKLTGCTLQVVGEYTVKIALNGEDYLIYQAGATHAQITAYQIPPTKLVIGENIIAFEVSPEAGRLQIMLEFKLNWY